MTTGLENLTAYSVNSSVSQHQQSGPARPAAWLLELEKALLALTANHNANQSGINQAEHSGNNPVALNENDPASRATNAQQNSSEQSGAAYSGLDSQFAEKDIGAQTADDMLKSDLSDKKTNDNSNGHYAGLAAVSQSALMLNANALLSLNASDVFLNTQLMQKSIAGINGENNGVSIDSMSKIDGPRIFGGTGFQVAAVQLNGQSVELSENETMNRNSPSADAKTSQQNDEYAKHQLHLYTAEDGVHAWIRDTELSQSLGHAVVQSLDAELTASGTRLVSATVNGVKVHDKSSGQDDTENADIYIEVEGRQSVMRQSEDGMNQGIYGKGGINGS